MSSVPGPDDILRSFERWAADPHAATPAGERPVKLGVVDASYSGYGPAAVRFDGETTTGTRTYIPLTSVGPGDRVALLPVGATFIILGVVSNAAGNGYDSGWQAVAFDAAIANGPQLRRKGDVVYPSGRAFQFKASGTLTSTFTTVGTAPVGFRPAQQWLVPVGSSLAGNVQGIVLPTGEMQLRTFEVGGMAYSASSSFSITTPWLTS